MKKVKNPSSFRNGVFFVLFGLFCLGDYLWGAQAWNNLLASIISFLAVVINFSSAFTEKDILVRLDNSEEAKNVDERDRMIALKSSRRAVFLLQNTLVFGGILLVVLQGFLARFGMYVSTLFVVACTLWTISVILTGIHHFTNLYYEKQC